MLASANEIADATWLESSIALMQCPAQSFDRTSFHSAIRRVCESNGFGAAGLARFLGVSRITAYSWLRGGSVPSLNTYRALGRALGVSLETLLRGDLTLGLPDRANAPSRKKLVLLCGEHFGSRLRSPNHQRLGASPLITELIPEHCGEPTLNHRRTNAYFARTKPTTQSEG